MEQEERNEKGQYIKGVKHPFKARSKRGTFLPMVREAQPNKPNSPWKLLKELHSGQLNIKTKFGRSVNTSRMILQADPLEYAKSVLETDIALLSAICSDLIQTSFADGKAALDDQGKIKLALGDKGYILFQNSMRQNIQALLKINEKIALRNKRENPLQDDISILLERT